MSGVKTSQSSGHSTTCNDTVILLASISLTSACVREVGADKWIPSVTIPTKRWCDLLPVFEWKDSVGLYFPQMTTDVAEIQSLTLAYVL